MRLFWDRGPATVRQLQCWLKDSDLAYTTIATLCTRLVEKGLLRQQVGVSDQPDRRAAAYVYTPLIAEADFVRAAVAQQLDGLLAHD